MHQRVYDWHGASMPSGDSCGSSHLPNGKMDARVVSDLAVGKAGRLSVTMRQWKNPLMLHLRLPLSLALLR